MNNLKNWFNKVKDQRSRSQQRQQVEQQYQEEFPQEIQIVPLEYQNEKERKLTGNGKYEYASNGQLTTKGKSDRFVNRLKQLCVVFIFGIIITYVILLLFP